RRHGRNSRENDLGLRHGGERRAVGPTDHYVSRTRLEAMLDRESARLVEQLGARRGGRTAFFVFADTVAARSYSRRENGHGWLGARFQTAPHGARSATVSRVPVHDQHPARD